MRTNGLAIPTNGLAWSADLATHYTLGDTLVSDPTLKVGVLSTANYCARGSWKRVLRTGPENGRSRQAKKADKWADASRRDRWIQQARKVGGVSRRQ